MVRKIAKHRVRFESLEKRLAMTTAVIDPGTITEAVPYFTTADSPANHVTGTGTQYDGVVRINVTGTVSGTPYSIVGNGSLLPNGKSILTAAHLLTLVGGTAPTVSSITVYFDLPSGTTSVSVPVSTGMHVNPNWNRNNVLLGADIAVLDLSSAAPAAAPRFDIYRGSSEVSSVVDKVGYGVSGQGIAVPGTYPYGTKRNGVNEWEAVLGGTTVSNSVLLYDFDDGTSAHDAFGVNFSINDLGQGNNEVCQGPGDSGAPSFIGGRIAGVTSFGLHFASGDIDGSVNSSFGEGVGDTRVSSFASWIDSVTDIVAPQVTGVTIGSSISSSADYSVPVGSGNQLKTVPVGQANEVSITFSEAIDTTSLIGFLSVVSHEGHSYSISSVSYNSTTKTATWTFSSAFSADQIELVLADDVIDVAGNFLDGEWTNPTTLAQSSSDTFPSGNGLFGGNFVFYVTILPGDANQDGVVNFSDYQILQNNYGLSGKTFTDGDFNGDGTVNFSDYQMLQNTYGFDYTAWPV
jgi:hypothetical protein